MFNFLSNPFRSDHIAERVRQVVSDQLGVPKRKIKPGHEFVEDLGADERDLPELMMALEDEFYIVLPNDEHAPSTVEQAIDYVKNELAKQTEDDAEDGGTEDTSTEDSGTGGDSSEDNGTEDNSTQDGGTEGDDTEGDDAE